jgi:tRNA nucleotidyltransferase (CCA-adding enzyme)
MELIVSHINADFDAFASMVAAKKLYPDAEPVFPGSQEKKLRKFIEAFDPMPAKRIKNIDLSAVDGLIVVDAKSPDRIGPLAELLKRPGIKVSVYDHHVHREEDIHGSLEVIEEVGATATIFSEILKDRELIPTPMEATILVLGIYEETGNLMFPSTTERDLRAAAWLLRCGASLNIVSTYLKTELSRAEVDLLNQLSHNSTEMAISGMRVLVSKASIDKYHGDAAHLAHRMIDMEHTDAVVLLLRMQDKVLIVGRSRAPEINVAEVLEEFGGGGHPTAASATIKEQPLEVIEERLTGLLRSFAKPGKFASDIMTRPVITIEDDSIIDMVEDEMTRRGVNVLPVQSDGKYAGIITREEVEKAIFHGFKNKSVVDFMTTDAETATRYTPVREVETIMIEKNQRFVPVVEDGEIKGAITRTDILRSMYEDYLRRSMIKESRTTERVAVKKNLSSMMKNRFPSEICDMLKLAGKTAEALNYNVYLVGGSVRDLLRGKDNFDMDLVIEGDGIEFAKELGMKLNAKVRSHKKFSTAKIISGNLMIDVATARTEYYESPAALPTVQMSSIKKDLYRRDFTINTLSIKLNPGDFGKLVDFFGGQRDLKEKSIRVLHNLSFVEDPTRAFRAVRFAERFGFKISKHTGRLIKSTLSMNLFEKLSGSRLYEELSLIFDEKEPATVIKRLRDYDLLTVIHPALEFTERLHSLLTSVHDTLRWCELSFMHEKPDQKIIYLMAFLKGLKDQDKEAALQRLSTPPKVKNLVIANSRKAIETIRRLPLGDPALVYDALSALDLDTLLFAMSLTEDKKTKEEMSNYLLELRKIKPLLDGEDLKRMGVEPGPMYSKLLREVLLERLRGKLKSRDDEEEFVRKALTAEGLKT